MTTSPNGAFMAQVARNLTDAVDGFLRGKKFLVVDRDTKFTEAFRKTLAGAGVETVLTAVRAPNMNAIAERFVRTIKGECLSKMAFFGEGMLRRPSPSSSSTTTPSAITKGWATGCSGRGRRCR